MEKNNSGKKEFQFGDILFWTYKSDKFVLATEFDNQKGNIGFVLGEVSVPDIPNECYLVYQDVFERRSEAEIVSCLKRRSGGTCLFPNEYLLDFILNNAWKIDAILGDLTFFQRKSLQDKRSYIGSNRVYAYRTVPWRFWKKEQIFYVEPSLAQRRNVICPSKETVALRNENSKFYSYSPYRTFELCLIDGDGHILRTDYPHKVRFCSTDNPKMFCRNHNGKDFEVGNTVYFKHNALNKSLFNDIDFGKIIARVRVADNDACFLALARNTTATYSIEQIRNPYRRDYLLTLKMLRVLAKNKKMYNALLTKHYRLTGKIGGYQIYNSEELTNLMFYFDFSKKDAHTIRRLMSEEVNVGYRRFYLVSDSGELIGTKYPEKIEI